MKSGLHFFSGKYELAYSYSGGVSFETFIFSTTLNSWPPAVANRGSKQRLSDKKHKNSGTMNINNESQNLKKLMKETFASRSVNFACQGLISSKNDAIIVRNMFC